MRVHHMQYNTRRPVFQPFFAFRLRLSRAPAAPLWRMTEAMLRKAREKRPDRAVPLLGRPDFVMNFVMNALEIFLLLRA